MNLDKYENSNRYGKTQLSESVMTIIKDSSGRFLKQSPTGGGWIEVEDINEVRDKVSHAFRARRQASKSASSSSTKGNSKKSSATPAASAATAVSSNQMLFRNM